MRFYVSHHLRGFGVSKPSSVSLVRRGATISAAVTLVFGTVFLAGAQSAIAGSYSPGISDNYAGYMVHNEAFTDAEGYVTVPIVTGQTDDVAAFWYGVNLGHTAAQPLVQSGVESDYGGATWLVYEVYPNEPKQTIPGFFPNLGDNVFTHATETTNRQGFNFIDGSVQKVAINYYPNTSVDGHAWAITERPLIDLGGYCFLPGLANFGTEYFTGTPQFASPAGWLALYSLSGGEYSMEADITGDPMAYPTTYDLYGNFKSIFQGEGGTWPESCPSGWG